ncbi:hypothetical protein [Pseudomonas sp. MWU16-30317]|uniref:hypothetical protein n=1 Tax=Pseudomonas sp. MWU16-30317 TaxID=2878095 RepID=UPI001CFB5510|nr:hypothetical protein [Pseudomonas sp. MWU16-30317]
MHHIIRACASLVALGLSTSVFAQWSTTIEDDIFSGGKKGMMLADIGARQAIAFDCDADNLTVSFITEGKWPADGRSTGWDLLIKVDQGKIHKFLAVSGQRNSDHLQYLASDKAEILAVVKEIKDAKSQILLGLQSKEYDSKWSGTVDTAGSTREANRFLTACKL